MKQRIVYLDVLRVLACMMVVLMHSPHPCAGVPGYVQVPLVLLTTAGVPIFFIVSGALILPSTRGVFSFLKHRLQKVVPPLIIWSLFYVFLQWLSGEYDLVSLAKSICGIPFSYQGTPELWFMYVLLSLYVITPILSPFLESSTKQEIELYLFLWGVTLSLPFIKPYLNIDDGTWGFFHYFMGFGGFYFLGYYLHRYSVSANIFQISLMICLPLLVFSVYKLMGWIDGLSDWHFYNNICIASYATGLFLFIRYIFKANIGINTYKSEVNTKRHYFSSKVLTELSNSTFGVYLAHIFVMRHLLWSFDYIVFGFGWIGQLILTWLLTLLISFGLTYLLSFMPGAEYIIGYKHK